MMLGVASWVLISLLVSPSLDLLPFASYLLIWMRSQLLLDLSDFVESSSLLFEEYFHFLGLNRFELKSSAFFAFVEIDVKEITQFSVERQVFNG
jgi:hypothetical protein